MAEPKVTEHIFSKLATLSALIPQLNHIPTAVDTRTSKDAVDTGMSEYVISIVSQNANTHVLSIVAMPCEKLTFFLQFFY